MTFEQIKESKFLMLTPAQVAEVLHIAPHAVRLMAADGSLPFPFIRSGNRTHIPRAGFIKWMEAQGNDDR